MGRLSFSLLVSQITSEDVKLYCIIIIKTSSQISCFWLCSLPYCPWDPRNTSWRFLLLKIIYIWLISIAEEWLNMHSKILVFMESRWYNHNAFRLMIIQYTSEGSHSLSILRALSKETGYVNTPYGKWNQPQHHTVSSIICNFTVWHAPVLSDDVTPNTDLAMSLASSPFTVIPVITISLLFCLNKSLCFFLEHSIFITVYKSKM